MVDFVGLLRKTIDAQRNADQALRGRVYARTRETVEKQMAGRNLPAATIALQRHNLEKAIAEIEAFYQERDAALTRNIYISGTADDVFNALQKNAGIRPPQTAAPAQPPSPQQSTAPAGGYYPASQAFPAAGAGNNFMPGLGPYGAAAEQQPNSHNADRASYTYPDSAFYPQNGNAANSAAGSVEMQGLPPHIAMPAGGGDINAPAAANGQNSPLPPPHIIPAGRANMQGGEAFGHGSGYLGEQAHYAPAPVLSGFAPSDSSYAAAPDFAMSADGQNYGNKKNGAQDFLLSDDAYTGGETFNTAHSYSGAPYQENSQKQPFFGESRQTAGDSYGNAAAALPFDLEEMYQSNEAEQRQQADFSSMPDFLDEPPRSDVFFGENSAADNVNNDENSDFNLEQALAGTDYIAGSPPRGGGGAANFPDMLGAAEDPQHLDVLLPGRQTNRVKRSAAASGDAADVGFAGESVASGIFAQAAIQEKRRSGKKRMLRAAIIISALLALIGGIFWFLTDFLKSDSHSIAAFVGKTAAGSAPAEAIDKANQRLMPDGQEVNLKQSAAAENNAAGASRDIVGDAINAQIRQETADNAVSAPAVFREAPTALMPETSSTGSINWSLLHEKAPTGEDDTILRGEITIPDKDMVARLTFRPNHDSTIPAIYLTEIMFVLPEGFEGVAVDKISPLMLKATEQSAEQKLQDMNVYKINNNFFVVTMNMPEQGINPNLQRNIAMIEQLPLLVMNIAYKNGRIGELTFNKSGDAANLFKQFFSAQSAALRGSSTGGTP